MERLPRDLQGYVVGVVAAAAALLWYLSPQVDWHLWPEMLLFAVLILLATLFPIPDPRGGYIVATPVLFYVLFAVHEPGAAALIASVSFATGLSAYLGWLPWRVILNGAQIGTSVAVAATIFRLAGGTTAKLSTTTFLLPFVLAAFAHQFANNLFVAAYYSRLRRLPLLPTWLADIRDLFASNLLSITSALLLAALYVSVHPLALLLYLLSLPAQRWALQLYLQKTKIHGQAIESLVVAIDAHFPQGEGHSRRVADVATAIARKLNLAEAAVEGIELAALIHDVGLIGLEEIGPVADIPSQDDPRARFREHVRIGAEVARDLPRKDVSEIVLHHHERYDGTGYPFGLAGERIPLGARIVALAEVYDTMVSGGLPDSRRMPHGEALRLIQEESGKAFDPGVVQAFVAALSDGVIAVRDAGLETAAAQAAPASD